MISFSNVTKKYPGIIAVDQASFNIENGEYFALLGPNGAGKTTLVKMMLDFIRPDSGTIQVDGVNSTATDFRKNIGYLAETHRIPTHLTAKVYLQRVLELIDYPSAEKKTEIERALTVVGMMGKENQRAGTLSKGMTQRIGLAAALLGNPRILLLDEPTSGLDPIGIREIRLILENLKGLGTTILLNSHLLSEVEKICDTAAIINRGKILVKDRIANIIKDGESLEDVFVRLVRGANE